MTLDVTTTDETKAPRMVVYGVHGIGKTTFGARLPNPVFLRTEDGMRGKTFEGVARLPLCEDFKTVVSQLQQILVSEHDYKTLVIDSVDWLEQLIHANIATMSNVDDISDIGYQAGYKSAASRVMMVLNLLSEINRRRNIQIVLLGHSEIKRYNSPDNEPYDRYGLALHKDAAPLVYEWADVVLFVNYEMFTKKTGEKFGQDTFQAKGQGVRVMYSEERPAYHAKNRYALPAEMPFDWDTLKNNMFNTKGKK